MVLVIAEASSSAAYLRHQRQVSGVRLLNLQSGRWKLNWPFLICFSVPANRVLFVLLEVILPKCGFNLFFWYKPWTLQSYVVLLAWFFSWFCLSFGWAFCVRLINFSFIHFLCLLYPGLINLNLIKLHLCLPLCLLSAFGSNFAEFKQNWLKSYFEDSYVFVSLGNLWIQLN